MTRILTIVDWYLPGYKAGGPIRTVSNMVELLSREFDFHLVTRDRDFGDSTPYHGIKTNSWEIAGRTHAYYASSLSLRSLRRRILEVQPDIIYLNSFFSRLSIKLLLLRRFKLIPECPVVLAPRGEFSPGALSIKGMRKKVFMWSAFRELYRDLLWHASTTREGLDIHKMLLRYVGERSAKVAVARNIHVAPDVPAVFRSLIGKPHPVKKSGTMRLVFLSRISRMKNPRFAIEACRTLRGNVQFDIYGPREDTELWQQCESAIAICPANVKINYCGPVPPDQVQATLSQYDFFVLPTLGENFGHVILEALGAGCPVLISDQTPWHDLEDEGIGWTLPLSDMTLWRQTLQSCVDMDNVQYQAMSSYAREFARRSAESPAIREENISLFNHALEDRHEKVTN